MKKLSNEELLVELEAPFSVDQILWRMTNLPTTARAGRSYHTPTRAPTPTVSMRWSARKAGPAATRRSR